MASRLMLVAATAGLALAQLGCAISSGNPPYPGDWAPEAGEPPSLADIFTAMADSKGATGPAAWKQSWPRIPTDAASVSIEQTPETMTVTFVDPAGRRTPLAFRRYRFDLTESRVDDLFDCRTLHDEPALKFFSEPASHSSTSAVAAGGGGTAVWLLKSVDGSLVVNWRSDALAVTVFIAGSGYRVDNLWYRYSPG